MARRRERPVNEGTQTITEGATRMATAGVEVLTQDQINELLASSRQRGEYDRQLKAFMDSNEPGVQISLTEGPFQGKKPQSVKTGFDGAIKREGAPEGAGNVRVIVHEDQVYLVNQNAEEAAA